MSPASWLRRAAAQALLALLLAGCAADGGGAGDRHDAGRMPPPDRLYVTSGFTDEVLRIDPSDGSVEARIPTDRRRDEVDEPHGIAVDPQRRHWYVTVAHGEPTLWKYELEGDRLVGRATLPTAGAARIGITPDGTRAFVPDYDRSQAGTAGRVAVVRLSDLYVEAAPALCGAPHHAEVAPAGDVVAVACSASDEIVLLDAVTLEERTRFPAGPEAGSGGVPTLKPLNLAWSPDGRTLWAGLHLAGAVREFGRNGEVVGTVEVGSMPAQLAMTPDGSTLAVANRGDGSISLVNTDARVERARVPLGVSHPHGLALDPSGRRAFVACEGTPETMGRIVAVDVEAASVLWSVEAGAFDLGAVYVSREAD